MHLYFSTTSPYARVARIALAEKGLADYESRLTDPWTDDPGLLAANPSARVPTLLLDGGLPLTESLLILLWLETQHPTPSLLGAEPARVIARTGIAMGGIDAAAAIIIGRRIDLAFDESPVGLRRRRSVIGALERLDSDPPALATGTTADLSVVTAVALIDYLRFRFAGAPWLPAVPALDELAEQTRQRASFAGTVPREMPKA